MTKHPYNQTCDCARCLNEAQRRAAQAAANPFPAKRRRRPRDLAERYQRLDDVGFFDHDRSDGEIDW
jgi:hypothetical protein